jgi:predicted AAA+ superfamily ATPase
MNYLDIPQRDLTESARRSMPKNPVTALIGPWQCGKTTLAGQLAARQPHEYFDSQGWSCA